MSTATSPATAGSRQYVELIGRNDLEYRGRATVRTMMLGLSFLDDGPGEAVRPISAPGSTWKIVADDGVMLGLRARDFGDPLRALADVDDLAAFVSELHVALAVDPETERISYWIMHGREIVIVGARLLAAKHRRAVQRDAERAISALRVSYRARDLAAGLPVSADSAGALAFDRMPRR